MKCYVYNNYKYGDGADIEVISDKFHLLHVFASGNMTRGGTLKVYTHTHTHTHTLIYISCCCYGINSIIWRKMGVISS